MIGIVNYGMGNLTSVFNAFEYLGEDAMICVHPEELKEADRIIIPGVGSFGRCAENLKKTGFLDALNEEVINKAKPTLGICLGMQIMAKKGFEDGEFDGLGWFDAEIIKINPSDTTLRVPNIGWNEISFKTDCPLFNDIPQNKDFYLVHSYYMKCNNPKDIIATYDYTFPVTAAVMKNNIAATQFHPEKSQDYGLKLLENFLSWHP